MTTAVTKAATPEVPKNLQDIPSVTRVGKGGGPFPRPVTFRPRQRSPRPLRVRPRHQGECYNSFLNPDSQSSGCYVVTNVHGPSS